MKRIIPLLACLFVGIGIGWYFGYTRPNMKYQRESMEWYHYTHDNMHLTDAHLIEMGKQLPQYFENEKQQDRMAAALALGAFKLLALKRVDDAKERLLASVGMYYRLYHNNGGDPQIIGYIEEAAKEYPEVAAEIARTNKSSQQGDAVDQTK